jgi:hypothetical protein
MRKKSKNFGTDSQIDYLISFLNQTERELLGPRPSALLSPDILRFQLRLRYSLADLVAPEAGFKLAVSDRATKVIFRPIVKEYLTAPNALLSIVLELNRQGLRPRWRIIENPKRKTPMIEVREMRAAVIMKDFGEDQKSRLWAAIATLLETGEIAKLGLCAICNNFYVKTRDWQKCCPKARCKRKYDNKQSADRKAKARHKQKRLNPMN